MADMGRDMKLYPLCAPWFGEEGAKYERRFRPDFISALSKERDKYATTADHAKGKDVGGVPIHPLALYRPGGALAGAAPVPKLHPGTAGSALRAESVLAFEQRSKVQRVGVR